MPDQKPLPPRCVKCNKMKTLLEISQTKWMDGLCRQCFYEKQRQIVHGT